MNDIVYIYIYITFAGHIFFITFVGHILLLHLYTTFLYYTFYITFLDYTYLLHFVFVVYVILDGVREMLESGGFFENEKAQASAIYPSVHDAVYDAVSEYPQQQAQVLTNPFDLMIT